MAKKISQLTQATEVKSDDVTVIVQDGETKKLPLNMMVTKQDIENKKVAGLAKLDEIEATYENDTYTPTITVKNKSSVKTGEGDEVDYSANVMDGHAKSAILKGNTLVNISNINKFSLSRNERLSTKNKVQVGKTYLQVIAITKNTLSPANDKGNVASINDSDGVNNFANDYYRVAINETGILKKVYTVTSTSGKNDTSLRTYSITTEGVLEGYEMLIEYQEGMENWDIPYFDGMQSVKMPVLKITGKNLFDGKFTKYEGIYGYYYLNNGTYTCSITDNDTSVDVSNLSFGVRDKDGIIWFFDEGTMYNTKRTITNGKLIFYPNTEGTFNKIKQRYHIQIEEGTVATPYKPYKSNILSCNEEITLRGIGDVKDTLDGNTGELTQRIGEIVLDGSLTPATIDTSKDNTIEVTFGRQTNMKIASGLMCDKLPNAEPFNTDVEGICCHVLNGNFHFNILKSKIENHTKQGVVDYLSQNPITVQYELETPTIKTVDLMPSGTHPSTTPYCWKNGHIQLSSSGLLPNLEYSVVTSRAGQINQNATMIVKNDKRIFDLEILLAGGLVNTTYQALTLQNQVETELSKVSLNSETEPDYLLYHMIMKLIEEKAYKLDDLTEKVSVFYLYEKLSDEQFETIYSALYPFVEDEIVEEPVVEELPEVVEDEVIM